MTAGRFLPMSVADYLASAETSDARHESIGAEIYARSGASTPLNPIAGNILAALRDRLRGTPAPNFH